MKHIFVVEDDKALCNGICMALKSEELVFLPCETIAEAKRKLAEHACELMILDINLPDGNGLDFLAEVRKESAFPVILLTANDMETDIVAGLESGADDYVTKPFSLAVLRARVNARLRQQKSEQEKVIRIDHFSFDFHQMKFWKEDFELEFSKTEQKLLNLLVNNPGITLERGVLSDRIWGNGADFVDENALSVAVKRLRDKLEENPAKPKYIKTVYGIGYVWAVKQDV